MERIDQRIGRLNRATRSPELSDKGSSPTGLSSYIVWPAGTLAKSEGETLNVHRLASRQARMSGQTLVFVPVVLLVITIFFCIAYNVSWYAKKRVALQEAADSAAVAGARVQGMMLEGIAVGNDAIAINVGQIAKDIASLGDIVNDADTIEDIIKRIGWIQDIKNAQDVLTGYPALYFTSTAAALAAPASGADFAFVLPPSNSSFQGVSISKPLAPPASSNPSTNVTRPPWYLSLFMVRSSATSDDPLGPYPITEKPVVVAFANIAGKLAIPVPFGPSHGTYMVATSAAAPYFIPENEPNDRPGTAHYLKSSSLRSLALFVPGPFWGARLDEVGNQGVLGSLEGWAAYAGSYLVSKYGVAPLNAAIKNAAWGQVEDYIGGRILTADGDELDSGEEE